MRRKHPVRALRRRIESHPLGARYLADVRFRTDVDLIRSVIINAVYIVLKLFLGICYNAWWFVALAVYYVLLVAMRLALESAMLAQFGGGDEAFRMVMTSATGGGVCVIVIGMAIYMIIRAGKKLRQGEQEHG